MILVLAAALAGCEPQPEPEPLVRVDACTLLAPKDVQELAGWAVTGTMSSTLDEAVGRDPSRCAYATGSSDRPSGLVLEIRQFTTLKRAESSFASARAGLARLGGGQIQSLSDLGDEAVWVGRDIEQLHVRKGRFYLIITAQTGQQQLLTARQIAERALPRLPKKQPAKQQAGASQPS